MARAYVKAKTVKAFAIANRDQILFGDIEPFTEEGRDELLRRINRPAGQRVVTVRITEIDH